MSVNRRELVRHLEQYGFSLLYRVARYVAFHDGPRVLSEILRVLISRVPLSPSEFLRASPLRVSIRLIPLSFTVRQGPAKEDGPVWFFMKL